jgi:hypothetical protein
MRKIALLFFVLAALPLASTSTLADGPELKLKSPRPTFMRPRMPNERSSPMVTVRITGELEKLDEAEDLEKYYCLDEVWDWDDDTESEYSPDCEPYEEGTELKRHFSASHQYRYPGTYHVRLRLERQGKTVISGTARVMIRN